MLGNPGKMKGSYTSITVQIGMIAFVGALLALIGFVQTSLVSFSSEMKVLENDIQVVDATHLVKECFENGGDSVPISFLKDNKDNRVCSISACNKISCSFGIGAKVEVLEGPKGNYNFQYSNKDSAHRIFVTVTDDQKNYVSLLTVSYSGKI
jgi:hypothetical protein